MILLIDNYDSFTYNLEQMLREIDNDVCVIRNDQITLDEVRSMKPAGIVISPGPGHPTQAGICIDIIKEFGSSTPILGVCLGMQAIAVAYGGVIKHAREIKHGKAHLVFHKEGMLFKEMPNPFNAARYHSLCVEKANLPDVLCVEGETDDGQVMAIKHHDNLTFGVQFHPESILTQAGDVLLKSFVGVCHAKK